MAHPHQPSGPFIGQGRKTADQRATEALDAAIAARGFVFRGIEPVPGGVIAIAVNGSKLLVHFGHSPTVAKFALARLAAAPAGRF